MTQTTDTRAHFNDAEINARVDELLDPELLEECAEMLERSRDYRVLRRLRPRNEFLPDDPRVKKKTGIILDVETTGIDPTVDEIVELAMIKFSYAEDGRVFRVINRWSAIRQPSRPIPPDIVALTGLTDEMVAGSRIDGGAIERFIEGADIVISHSAAYDRKFVEVLFSVFRDVDWGCSYEQIDWNAEDRRLGRLLLLLASMGFYYDSHRALADAQALLEVLARPLPKTKSWPLAQILAARKPSVKIWVEAPFAAKEFLKMRGYRWWNGRKGPRPKAWWRELKPDDVKAEIAALLAEHPRIKTRTSALTAKDRFSIRA